MKCDDSPALQRWASQQRVCLLESGMRFVGSPKAPNERQSDPELKEKHRQELSGILAWLVRGCLAFQQ